MIFSKLFKNKWQHKDANVRITAIADLDENNPEHQSILLDLLTNDADDNVRKTALLKLGTLTELIAARNNNSNSVVNLANKQIEKKVSENSLSAEEKHLVIDNLGKAPFFETWFEAEQDEAIVKKLYKQIVKPQNMLVLFNKKQDEAFQRYVLESVSELAQLEKFAKKAKLPEIKSALEEQVNALKEAEQKPIELAKTVQLLLSKYLALKDQIDYQTIVDKRKSYDVEWLASIKDFSCLDDAMRETFESKHVSINLQLDKVFAQKEETYQQQLIEQQLLAAKQHAKTQIQTTLTKLTDVLSEAVFNNQLLDEEQYSDELEKIREFIEQSPLSTDDKQAFIKQTDKQLEKLKQLPMIAESVTEATHLVSRISQLAIPQTLEELNERYGQYQEWLSSWSKVEKQSLSSLPASILSAKKEIVQQWQQGIEPLQKEQKAQLGHARKAIADIRRLLNLGKYNACFGVHKKLMKIVESLSEKQRFQLQRDIERINQKMDELSDWEHYIATPRKQELLAEIKTLVEQPLDNPNDQANKVKQYRKAWNQLGHADDDKEKPLNDEFNDACEKAFAPCRQYYAEQDKIREQHAQTRQSVIASANELASQLDAESIDWKSIDGKVNHLVSQWRKAGDVDRSRYIELKEAFDKALKPIKNRVYQFQQANADEKSELITKAEKLLEIEDNQAAIEHVKTLQQAWKQIGFAGTRKDNQLWSKFRKVNDQLFNKRDQIKSERNSEIDLFKVEISKKLDVLTQQLNETADKKSIGEIMEQGEQLLLEVKNFKPVLKVLITQIEKLIQKGKQSVSELQKRKSKQVWFDLFACIEQATNITNEDELLALESYKKLQPSWQKRLTETLAKAPCEDRTAKTLEIEILAGLESPSDFAQQRLQLQVKLMQSHMQSGGLFDKTEHLQEWLQLGQITQQDASLIARIKPVYC